MMDKVYVNFEVLYWFHKTDAFWICRPKANMRYEIVDHKEDFDVSTGVRGDFTIRLTTYKSPKLYSEYTRKVCYNDAINGNEVEFITNNFEIEALEITNLYRHKMGY